MTEDAPLARGTKGILIFAALLVGLCSVLPTLRLVVAGLLPDGTLSLDRIAAVLGGRTVLRAALGSLEAAAFSSILALALGTAMAVAVAATDAAGRRAAAFLFVLSMMISPQVIAVAFLHLAGPASPLLNTFGLSPPPGAPNPLLGRTGVVLVLGLHHAPLVFVVLVAGLKRIPLSVVEAARTDGVAAHRIIGGIVLPLLRPHLLGAGLLAFVAGLGNFGIPALLGLPANYLTLPTLIYRRLSSFGPGVIADLALLGTLVGVLAAACVLASSALTRGEAARLEDEGSLRPFWHLGRSRFGVSAAMHAVNALVLGLPLLSLAAAALVPSYGMALTFATATLDNFTEVLIRQDVTRRAFSNSLLLAGSSAVVLGCLALPVAYGLVRRPGSLSRWLMVLLEIPYVLPGIVLAIACILLFLKPLPGLGLSLYGTPWIIIFAYLARFLAVALKPPLAAMAQFELTQEEAAALDGAGLLRRMRNVVAPSLLPATVAGAVLAFLLAFNELTVSALLWSAGTETLGVVLFSLEEAGLASQAAAVALTTVVMIAAAMLAVDRLGDRLPEGALPWRP